MAISDVFFDLMVFPYIKVSKKKDPIIFYVTVEQYS
jgi:hypothetical protein